MIPKPRPLYKKLVHARHKEIKLTVEYIVYFIFGLRNIRKKFVHGTVR